MNGTMHVPERRSLADHLSAPHHHHGGHTFRPYRYPAVSYGPAFDLVDPAGVIQSHNTCVPTSSVAASVAATLRSRGWRDDVLTVPSGKQIAVLCPPGVSPAMIRGLGRVDAESLGDIIPYSFRVHVTDLCGKPWPGIQIQATAGGGTSGTVTNDEGAAMIDFIMAAQGEKVTIVAHLPEGSASHVMDMNSDAVLMDPKPIEFKSTVPAPKALVTWIEGGLGGAGLIMTAIGYTLDIPILQRFGELGIVAAVFTRIGRA